jgi:hypothetical protein
MECTMNKDKGLNAKIIDTTYYSIGFPEAEEAAIQRENYLTQFNDLFSSGVKIIFFRRRSWGRENNIMCTICKKKY